MKTVKVTEKIHNRIMKELALFINPDDYAEKYGFYPYATILIAGINKKGVIERLIKVADEGGINGCEYMPSIENQDMSHGMIRIIENKLSVGPLVYIGYRLDDNEMTMRSNIYPIAKYGGCMLLIDTCRIRIADDINSSYVVNYSVVRGENDG